MVIYKECIQYLWVQVMFCLGYIESILLGTGFISALTPLFLQNI